MGAAGLMPTEEGEAGKEVPMPFLDSLKGGPEPSLHLVARGLINGGPCGRGNRDTPLYRARKERLAEFDRLMAEGGIDAVVKALGAPTK